MREKDFWKFLKNVLAEGRMTQVSGVIDSNQPELAKLGKFISGHSLLPKDPQKIPIDKIMEMGDLLLSKKASVQTKEAILMLLAHHPSKEALSALKAYNNEPDRELELFAQFALEECEMWNE